MGPGKKGDALIFEACSKTNKCVPFSWRIATEETPVYFKLPWSEKTAKELRDAMDEVQRNQTPLMYRFERSLKDRGPMFYAIPQPAVPEKEPPEPGFEYRNNEWV